MKSRLRHSFEYILIAAVLIAGMVGLTAISDYSLRLGLIGLLAVFYVVVGIWHHHEEKNLHFKQVLEHLGIGVLIFVVLAAVSR